MLVYPRIGVCQLVYPFYLQRQQQNQIQKIQEISKLKKRITITSKNILSTILAQFYLILRDLLMVALVLNYSRITFLWYITCAEWDVKFIGSKNGNSINFILSNNQKFPVAIKLKKQGNFKMTFKALIGSFILGADKTSSRFGEFHIII